MKRILCLILIMCMIVLHPQKCEAKSNERFIYEYLTEILHFKESAACGIMANIKRESGYNPKAGNSSGHFGLCQWSKSRKARLIRWCKKKGYNYQSIKGQLRYMKFELKNYYPKVYKKLKSVKNNLSGAYNAGYYFCYYYEVPGSRKTSSVYRGRLARKLLKKYAY